MDVILLERIEKLGQMGDVVTVKPGFARNYLLPQKKAMRATEENRKRIWDFCDPCIASRTVPIYTSTLYGRITGLDLATHRPL